MDQDIPKIKKLVEVGENPFQFVSKSESILQGFDQKIQRTIYLFKTDSGAWGYFDKDSSQVIEVTKWKEKAALVNDHWVKMAIYHRIIVNFLFPLNYTGWDDVNKVEVPAETSEAILLVTDNTYKQILEQLNGRAANSVLKFHFVTRKIGKRQATFIDKVLWVS